MNIILHSGDVVEDISHGGSLELASANNSSHSLLENSTPGAKDRPIKSISLLQPHDYSKEKKEKEPG